MRERHPDGESSGESEGKRVTDCSLGPQTRAGSLPPTLPCGLAPLKATLSIRPGCKGLAPMRRSVATAWETLAIQMSVAPSQPRVGFLQITATAPSL